MTLDLEANTNLIQTAAADLPSQLQASRATAAEAASTLRLSMKMHEIQHCGMDYFTGILKQQGFRAEVNDPVVLYLGQHLNAC